MLKKEVQETIKEVLELGSLKEADKFIEDLVKVVEAVGDKLEERPENEASDKATIGNLVLDKKFIKGRSGCMNGKDWTTPDHYEVKSKIK